MKTTIKRYLLSLLALPMLALGASFALAPATYAQQTLEGGVAGGANAAKGDDQSACLFGNEPGCDQGQTPIFRLITNVLLFIIGAVSVIMLIIGGIRYTVSAGDSSAVQGAKNTILYAIVGIVVAILAYAVVNFVIGSFVGGDN